jgi:epoxyqueuosine reductase QueG
MTGELREKLLGSGAAVVGFADVGEALRGDISHLTRAVSIGVYRRLSEDTLKLLSALRKKTESRLRAGGYRYLGIPPDSDRVSHTFVSRLYPLFTHKIAATCAGLGWIGKNGLLINPEYGARLSLATVLTDAPLEPDSPVVRSLCGKCNLCMEYCPADAITGEEWSRNSPFPVLVDEERCAAHKKIARASGRKPNCGLCITICPYGRNNHKEAIHRHSNSLEDL